MTEQEEEFIHFRMCISAVNNAWCIFTALLEEKNSNELFGSSFRYALIEYSKPYRESRGEVKKRRRLDTSCVPQNMLKLHKRITDARDQIHAHIDLNILDAKLYVHKEAGNQYAQICKNNISGLEEIANLKEILLLVQGTLENMYAKEKILETALP